MAQRKRLSTVSVDHGRLVLLAFESALEDNGQVDPHEVPAIRREIVDWLQVARATDVAQQVGNAIARGIGDPEYLHTLVGAYQRVTDELPEAA